MARFVGEHDGVLLIRPPGTGKSHIATALTAAAIQADHTEVIRLQRRSYRMYNRRELRSKQADEILTGQTN
jgi:energy-coupling factor transporter ATP-binding protein EcfA2